MKKEKKSNKGFLLTLEVTLALVLIFSLVAIFFSRMLFQRDELRIENLADIGEEGLSILNEYGILTQDVYTDDFEALNNSLRFVLPANIEYNFLVYNQTGKVISVINGESRGTTANVIYFLYNQEGGSRRIDLILWYQE